MPFVAWAAFCLALLCMGALSRYGVCVVPCLRTAVSCMARPAYEAYLLCDAAWWGCRRDRTRIVADGASFRSASAGHAVYRFRRWARLTWAKLRAMLGLPFHACLSEEDVAWTFLSRLPNK